MKKSIKIILIIFVVLLGILLLDTLQARIFKHSPIISFKEELKGSNNYVDRGIIMDTFYCTKEQDIVTVSWHLKGSKFTCPIYEEEDASFTKIIIDSKEMRIKQKDYDALKTIFNSLDYKMSCSGKTSYVVEIENKKYDYYRWNNTVGYNDKCAEIDGDNLTKSYNILTYVYSDNEMNNIENVSMVIKEDTLTRTGATVIITDTNEEHYQYGMSFRIDKKENEIWNELEITGNVAFNSMAYSVDKDNQLELNQDWDYIYGSLENGEYRLVKDVCVNDGCTLKKYFSAQFTIE